MELRPRVLENDEIERLTKTIAQCIPSKYAHIVVLVELADDFADGSPIAMVKGGLSVAGTIRVLESIVERLKIGDPGRPPR